MTDMVEAVARAIALANHAKGMRSPKPEWLTELVERDWKKFTPEARLVIETINRLVQDEEVAEEIQRLEDLEIGVDLPALPAFLINGGGND